MISKVQLLSCLATSCSCYGRHDRQQARGCLTSMENLTSNYDIFWFAHVSTRLVLRMRPRTLTSQPLFRCLESARAVAPDHPHPTSRHCPERPPAPSCAPLLDFSIPSSSCPSCAFSAPAAHAMPSTSPFWRRSGGRPRPWRGLAAVVAISSFMMVAGAVVGLVLRGGGAVGLSGGVSFVLGGLGKTVLALWQGGGKGSAVGEGAAYNDFQTLPSGLRIKDGTWRGARGWQPVREALVRGGKQGCVQRLLRMHRSRLSVGCHPCAPVMRIWQSLGS